MDRTIFRAIIELLLPHFYCPECLDEINNFLYIVTSYKDPDVMFGSVLRNISIYIAY